MSSENTEITHERLAARLWQELTRAPHDRHHDWRTPVLATQGLPSNGPQVRTVVLRQADAASWTLRVYTDARSPKCAELAAQPLAQLGFWSKRLNWQLRVSARVASVVEGESVQAAWEKMRASRAAADYLSPWPPGHIQSARECGESGECGKSDGAPPAGSPQLHHLAILNFQVLALDWLALGQDGHRRARLTPAGALERLVP
ncbi:MAG: pyridoxamine 5'-phosphate oxidase family protein [Limnohabitans sp.]